MMVLLWILIVATLALVVYLMPAIRRFKQRYDFAQTLTGPSFFELVGATRQGSMNRIK